MTAGGHGSCRDPAANRNELYVLPLALTVRRNSETVSAGKVASEPSQPTRRPSNATRLLPLARPLPRLVNRNSPSAGAEPYRSPI